jgi:beta-glucanase (GH16 family)
MKVLVDSTNKSHGARISTTRYALYGKFSIIMAAAPIAGIVTAFITMSGRGDEIDWEIVGSDVRSAQSNVFYKSIKEYVLHGGTHGVPMNGTADRFHKYTIDWKQAGMRFYIDDILVRTYLNDASAVSPMTPKGERWLLIIDLRYPKTPSQIQFSIWDGCADPSNAGACKWAGGPTNYTQASSQGSTFYSLDIQCYDNNDRAVPKWPLENNPDYANTEKFQIDPKNSTDTQSNNTASIIIGIILSIVVIMGIVGYLRYLYLKRSA